jgi:D-alanyl-D-alanine carboxypeptidase
MRARRRTTVLAASLVLALGAAPLADPAFAASAPAPAAAHGTTTGGLDTAALGAALDNLPDQDATFALVRVGGTDGTWRGSAGVHDLESGRAADPDARFRAGSTTKVVTAAVVLQLVAEGKIHVNYPSLKRRACCSGSPMASVVPAASSSHTRWCRRSGDEGEGRGL